MPACVARSFRAIRRRLMRRRRSARWLSGTQRGLTPRFQRGHTPLKGEDRPAVELDRVDVGRELEMVAQRLRDTFGIVGGAALEQLDVELLVSVRHGALGEEDRAVPLAAVPGRTDQPQ